MRYIMYYEIPNTLKNYLNENLLLFINKLSEKLGHIDNGNYEYKKTKRAICEHINQQGLNYQISKKQLSRLVRPRKHKFSKYAPVYLIAILEMLLENGIPEGLHQDICTRNAYDDTYANFALNKILELIYQCYEGRPNDADILFFLERLGELNERYNENLGRTFM